MAKIYQCGCGEFGGERCAWSGNAAEMVVVEYMPEFLRAPHTAAGNSGFYPQNGAVRVAVERSCAEHAAENDIGWTYIIDDADPAEYAEEASS